MRETGVGLLQRRDQLVQFTPVDPPEPRIGKQLADERIQRAHRQAVR